MKLFRGAYKGHYKPLIYLGIPIVIGQLGVVLLGFADTFMIGRHGTDELAAASFVNNMFTLAIIFTTGFSYGLTPVVGALYGNKKLTEAGQALKSSVIANILIGLLATLAMFILFLFVDRLGQPEELLPLIKPYYIILLVSILFVVIFNAFKQFTDGITDTRVSMWIMLGGNLLNIIGNYILIYGKLGLPEMGLLGAGISTLFSRIAMVVVFVLIFLYRKSYAPYKSGFLRLRFSRETFKRLNSLGWPIGLQMGMETSSFSLSTVMVGWLGTIALASHQVMLTISTFSFMVYYGMGAAIAVRVSNFRGQNDWENVRKSAYAGFHIIMVMALGLSLILFLLRNHLGGWFTDGDVNVSETVVVLMIPMLLYQFGDGMQLAFANALRGISDVKPMMVIGFIAYFVISLPVAYLFGFTAGWGMLGIWMGFPFGLTTAGILFWLRFRAKSTKLLDRV